MNRNFVQKALVVISNLPFFGQIASIMQPTTQVYFEQKDFINTAIIAEVFESLQTSLVSCTVSDLTIGFSPRMLVHMFKEKVMVLWKIILLRGRILVFSKKPSVISSVILALVSLFPGELCFGKFQFCEKYEKHLRSFGLPLGLFGENCAFHPYFSLFQLGELEKQGYLVGCTNQMIMEHPKAAPNALINLETMKIKFNLPGKLAKCVKLNSHETKFIKEICKVRVN